MKKTRIYSGSAPIEIMGIKNLLETEGIECFELNKSDSSYAGLLDNIELYVDETQVEKALAVLKTLETE
ncbi:MAG: DUF2007 domain-containing protein [Marinifilaceae bacterium]